MMFSLYETCLLLCLTISSHCQFHRTNLFFRKDLCFSIILLLVYLDNQTLCNQQIISLDNHHTGRIYSHRVREMCFFSSLNELGLF